MVLKKEKVIQRHKVIKWEKVIQWEKGIQWEKVIQWKKLSTTYIIRRPHFVLFCSAQTVQLVICEKKVCENFANVLWILRREILQLDSGERWLLTATRWIHADSQQHLHHQHQQVLIQKNFHHWHKNHLHHQHQQFWFKSIFIISIKTIHNQQERHLNHQQHQPHEEGVICALI